MSKLLVPGEGGVGKASLIKTLAGDAHEPKEPTTHEWLDVITACAPGSPIMPVATHLQGRPVDLSIDDLHREDPMIVKNISVDRESRHGAQELYTQPSEEAAKLPLMGSKLRTMWLATAESLRNPVDKHVTPQRMWQMI